MDKLAQRLREDADKIDARLSPQLEERLRASLENATREGAPAAPAREPTSFWWASSLTGIAATLAVIAIVNLSVEEPGPAITEPPPQHFAMQFDWRLEPAVLTQTLEQELVALQSDLRKAEQVVRDDIGQIVGELPQETETGQGQSPF